MQEIQGFAFEIINAINKGLIKNKKELHNFKIKKAKKFNLKEIPSNPTILSYAEKPTKKLIELLSIKPIRTLSGVTPIAIMCKPHNCPHGRCIYCPGGINSVFGSVPQSYTGFEPATLRAKANNYNAFLQTMNRLAQYVLTGHNVNKIELILMGGTFLSLNKSYKKNFVRDAFKALNDFSDFFSENKKISLIKVKEFFKEKNANKELIKLNKTKKSLSFEQKRNEKSNVRCVTFCIETRPDYCKKKQINEMLSFGVTRVELGVQTLKEEVLKFTNRAHSLKDSIEATQLLKDSFLKVGYHIMPGQPLTSKEEDIQMFKELFENNDFKPDSLKIYPLMLMKGTALEKIFQAKKFKPLNDEEAAEIIAEGKKFVPEYCRIHRLQRDIPTKYSIAGIKSNNLRQLIEKKMKEKKIKCKCIRCREAGIKQLKEGEKNYSIELNDFTYEASNGIEVFIKAEDKKNDMLFGFARLRIPFKPFRKEITSNSAGIRELHVFGESLPFNYRKEKAIQHKGIGKMLLSKAEQIALERFDARKLLVISGIGAREYYYKLGYKRDGVYVSKNLAK